MNIQMVKCDMEKGKAVKRGKGRTEWLSCYFIPCGQGEDFSNKMTLEQRSKVYYIKFYGKNFPVEGRVKA